ncbi:MAG TPA: glycosyltransferase [Solirubrobacterales bacterium]|nr:glycosyltransferase [Solirubrobacterales bacterium]
MPSVQHLLETRFSVKLGWDLPAGWLPERIELLRRFTLPSVAAQTTSAFTWLVLCDDATDPSILEQLRAEEQRLPALRLALTGDGRTAIDVVRAAVDPDVDVLITTRLDSDDAIADRYLEAVQDYAASFHRSSLESILVNFARGYRLDVAQERFYASRMTNNAFHSLFERPRSHSPQTVMSAGDDRLRRQWFQSYDRITMPGRGGANWHSHAHLHQHYPTHQDESMPAWLVAVHGGNLLNRIKPNSRPQPKGFRPPGFTICDEPGG